MNDDQNQQEALFEQALKYPSAQARAAFLDDACRGHPQLRARLNLLLEGHFMGQGFLEGAAEMRPLSADEHAGATIGRYKLLERIGEGGFGVVYLAEQREPVKRRVALKIIKPGMDTKQVVARFEAERQALAMMDHPNIAKVFDGGTTESPHPQPFSHPMGEGGRRPGQPEGDLTSHHSPLATHYGRPYFVMELVLGVPITTYCDEQQLSTNERLRLFVQVCEAVRHAHQKGIIHRDLKPSNILVSVNDGRAVPKVIDFGVAKAMQQELTEKTFFTHFHHLIGTPAYMSPEQARISGMDVDTRSDIYSLGVLLYELLTGQTPFDGKELLSSGLDEMRRIILEVEPVKPSTRLTQELARKNEGEEKTDNGRSSSASHSTRNYQLSTDLDWIVMKCLEKDPARRYETANGLVADLGRHLNHEPVVARPPSKLYRFKKSVQRNKLAYAAAGAIVAALVIGLAVSAAMYFKAQAEKKKAQTEAAKSMQVTRLLKQMLEGVSPSVALGRDRTMLEAMLKGFGGRVGLETNQPEVQAELYETLAYAYHELEQYDAMEEMSRKALGLYRAFFGDFHPAVARSMTQLGDALRHGNDLTQAEPLLRDGVVMYLKLVGTNGVAVDAMNDLGQLYHAQERLVEAERVLRLALAGRNQLPQGERNASYGPLHNLTLVLQDQRRYSEAEELLTNAIASARLAYNGDHPQAVRFMRTLGEIYRLQSRYREAEILLKQVMEASPRLFGEEAKPTCVAINALASVLETQGRYEDAEPLRVKLVDIEKRRDSRSPDSIVPAINLASLYMQQGRYDLAESHFTNLFAVSSRLVGTNHPRTLRIFLRLAFIYQDQKRLAKAEEVLTNALSLARGATAPDAFLIVQLSESLARVYVETGRHIEAETLAADCFAFREREAPDAWETFEICSLLGRSLLEQKEYTRAEPMLFKAAEGLSLRRETIPVRSKALFHNALQSLVQCYQELGRTDEAEKWKQKLTELNSPEK